MIPCPCFLRTGLALVASAVGASVSVAAIQTSVVFHYPKSDPYDRANLYGFNHAPNVATLPDGSLMAAWFSGAFEGDVHQVVLGSRSRDGGITWEKETLLADIPRTSDFDPAFLVDGDRMQIFLAAGRWNRYPFVGMREAEKVHVGLDSFRLYVIASADSGRTFSAPVMVSRERGFCCRNGIVLKGGKRVLPIYDQADKGRWVTSLLVSDNGGDTWSRVGRVGAAEGKAGGEPTIVELKDGSILVGMRSTDGRIWFARSRDEGVTWSEPFASEFDAAASACALYRTREGRVFLAYDASKPPHRSPLVVRELEQSSMQWGQPVEIARAGPLVDGMWTRQVSYPSLTQARDGALVVVWTELSMSPTSHTGKIMSARMALP